MSSEDRPLVWLAGEVKTPPFSEAARLRAGYLLRKLQQGDKLSMPFSRPMTSIGGGCGELRIVDGDTAWRLVYRADEDAVIILEVFKKKSAKTPKKTIEVCKKRLKEYEDA